MVTSNLRRTADVVALLAALALCWIYLSKKRSRRYLPPGPRPLPILGNLFDLPKSFPWAQHKNWAKKYGLYNPMGIFSPG
jgi:hypothetical protein